MIMMVHTSLIATILASLAVGVSKESIDKSLKLYIYRTVAISTLGYYSTLGGLG